MFVSDAPHGMVGKFKRAKSRSDLSVETARAGVHMGGKGLCLDLCHYCSVLLPQSSKLPHLPSSPIPAQYVEGGVT